jgi:signal transduction histidine kinase
LEAQLSHVQADALKLEQVFSNLIRNALKFTPKGGRVSIVTRNEANGALGVEVSDTGIGIPAEALSRIFSPFEQGDSSIHPRYGGLGLGLSIARTLTKAHGGTLEAASEGLGKGAKFTARFKIDDSPSDLITNGSHHTTNCSLQVESSQPPGAKASVVTSLNSTNGKS